MATAQRKIQSTEIDPKVLASEDGSSALADLPPLSPLRETGHLNGNRSWAAIALPMIFGATALGLLVHFAGLVPAILIIVGIIAFLAICINRAISDTIDL